MPLYEYICTACGLRFERIRKFSDPPLTDCPTCGGIVEKQLSSPAIQFKGSGFYITDYAKSGKSDSGSSSGSSSKSASESGSATSSTSEKTETKSDSSAAASKESKPAAAPVASPSKPDSK